MKKAFTMIELIFIIVIIGILASVAIPKLSATRDDAKVVSMANAISNAVYEVGSYAIAQGKTENLFADMSNAVNAMVDMGQASQAGSILSIKMGSDTDCVKFQILDNNLSITHGAPVTDKICTELQGRVQIGGYPVSLLGKRVKF